MTVTTFTELSLHTLINQAVAREGYTTPTPIQAQAIPAIMEGKDVLGLAQTGTGKTAAFTLPMLNHLVTVPGGRRIPRALILAPTRELAIQISDSIKRYGAGLKLYHMQIVGGASQNRQVETLRKGVDIVIATPGRLEDLMQQRLIDISKIEIFVLDEADRMLEIGFMPSIRRIVAALPKKKQTLFFSATMPRDVADLAHGLLHHPVRIEVAPVATPIERIAQSVIYASVSEKRQVLVDLLANPALERVIVFTRTKHGADKVARILERANVATSVMHGNKSQNQRQLALGAFGKGQVRVLVATDVAARGIDVDDVTHVINYDVPHEPETYVHRIGRTARAGKAGVAISLCDGGEEKAYIRQIERLTRHVIPTAGMPEPSGYIVPPPGLGNGAPPRSRPQDSRGRFQTGAKGQGDRRPRSDERQPRADDRKPREDRAPRPESRSRENPARSEERRTTRPERQFTRREQPARSRDDELGPVVPHESAAPRTAAKPVKKPFWKLKSGGKPRGEGRAAPSGAVGRRKV